MKTYFLAAFVPEEDGGFSVFFPDIHNCFTCGDTLEESMEMAEDVLATVLQSMAAENKPIPVPTSLESVKSKLKVHLDAINEPLPDDTQYQLVAAPSLDMVPVRINVSLPRAVLEDIDKRASLYGFTRSGFLAQAAKAYHL